MKAKTKDYRFFEQWARRNGMLPIQRIADVTINGKPVADILLVDSGDLINAVSYPPVEGQEHRMFAFYRTGFAIDRGDKTWFATFNDYSSDAFSEYASKEGKQGQRLKEAVEYATRALMQSQEVGLYERSPQIH